MPLVRPLLLVLLLASAWSGAAAPLAQQLETVDPQLESGQATAAEAAVHEARVADLLARMTLAEKVGQMTQVTVQAVADGRDHELSLDPEKLRAAVVDDGVGSILNVWDYALPVERWRELIAEIQGVAAESRLGIPVLYGLDSIHGANYVAGSILYPQPLALAATWNPELVAEVAERTAAATRAAGVPWNFAPVLDVGRQPLWPRLWETFGEDVYLASVLGVATVRGLEGYDIGSPLRVASSLKHYVGYSLPTSGHDRTPALIPEVVLREYLLPPFAAAVKAGARTVMVNSGEVNGIPGHANRYLLTDVLRDELGFEGVVVTDWEDIKRLVTMHRVAADEKEATRIAVEAGIDMSMVPYDTSFAGHLIELVEEGAIPVERIDASVERILMLKSELGLFDDPTRGVDSGFEVGSAESAAVARQAARESITLLENRDGTLPLDPEMAKVLVTGPTSDSLVALNNGWSRTWQGDLEELFDSGSLTIVQALRQQFGEERVEHRPGVAFDAEIDVEAAVAAAREADVAIVCLGEMSYTETPGNIHDLSLPEAQLRLAREIQATGTPTVLVLVQGRPRIVSPIVDAAAAVVMAYNPGSEGGVALAEVLAGDVNPSGRLPLTYPRAANALRTYDHKASETLETHESGFDPQWEFGAGLSYTSFAYADLEVDAAELDAIRVAVTVTNTGERAGVEVVQLFTTDHVASITPPVKRLRRFERVELEPGTSERVQFTLGREDLAFVGVDLRWRFEPGVFTFDVGGLTRELWLE